MVVRNLAATYPFLKMFLLPNRFDVVFLASMSPFGPEAIERARARFQDPRLQQELEEIGLSSMEALLALELWFSPKTFTDGPSHTLDQPRLSYQAEKDIFYGHSFSIAKYLETGLAQVDARRVSSNALIVHWLNRDEISFRESLGRYTAQACGTREAKFFANWMHAQLPCRKALVALSVRADLETESNQAKEDIQSLKTLLADRQESLIKRSTKGLKGAFRHLDLYMAHQSVFLPLSAERLRKSVAPCFASTDMESVQCRTYYVTALALSGNDNLAKTELHQLLTDSGNLLPTGVETRLRELVDRNH